MPGFFKKAFTGVVPERAGAVTVGLDIGTFACKGMKVKKAGSAYTLLDWTVVPVEGGDQKKAVKQTLRNLSAEAMDPFTAVSGKGTLIRYIEFPRMPLADLRKSFAIEADKYFPFPLDQIYTDCHILNTALKDNKMLVLVAAAKKEIIDDRVAFLTELGYHPNFISLNAVAISNIMNVLNPKMLENPETAPDASKHAAVAILDIGEVVSNLTIMVQGMPLFTRDVFIGGRDFTKALTNSLSLRYEEAESLKRNPKDQLDKVLDACESVIINLVSELRLSFDYFMTEKNVGITHLLLTGGTSQLEGMDDIIFKNLDIKVSRWNPFPWLTLGDTAKREDLESNTAFLSVALGLSLYS
ncbi:MAG TPA: type IV pilus assembly protein PilM [Candidatus Omnitrophota bacterium]|nr:type IV pilus assembly protein PilM [Candidatus Omnitrophota bacterium]HQO57103.1 type IV pilus assembly protein PilM [Candidatus Omnitrophota bacterium]HQP11221.1 type IV pilus assembly protein PilM [Candidatus Omnitrophota bacterium]